MLRINRLFFTFICLSVAFSSRAQDSVGLRVQAAQAERQAFEAANPLQFNEAMMLKARCLERAEDYAGALESLNRLRMFALRDKRDSVTMKKAELAYRMEDYDTSMAYLKEAGRTVDYIQPKLKNPYVGMGLTFLVPAGFIYVNDWKGAGIYTVLNAASVGWIVLEVASQCWVNAILGGAMALNVTFLGAQEKVALQLEKHNLSKIKESKRQTLSPFFQASSEGRTARPE